MISLRCTLAVLAGAELVLGISVLSLFLAASREDRARRAALRRRRAQMESALTQRGKG